MKVSDDILRAIIATGSGDFEVPDFGGDPSSSSVGFLHHLIPALAGAQGLEIEAVVVAAVAELEEAFRLALGAAEKVDRLLAERAERAERRARAHLPADDDNCNFLKWKRTFERSLEKWIALLESSKLARADNLPPPIRVQVSEE